MTIPRVLIVAGSDSGGGAGLQADLKTVSALGAFGMTAITALTAQNTKGVYEVIPLPPAFVAHQIEVCVTDIGCDAVKIGMLANAAIVEAVAEQVCKHRLRPLVVDPVMASKTGSPLLEPEATDALKTKLFPLATVVTPNRYEAEALTGMVIQTLDDMKGAAKRLHEMGVPYVVVKGGHLEEMEEAVDVFYDGQDFIEFRAPRYEAKNTHGTGCIFASAIAAGLAAGKDIKDALSKAKEVVTFAIRFGLPLGEGNGPADPMALWRRQRGASER